MKTIGKYICFGGAVGIIAVLSGCGAPDLNAMHPQVKKTACAVLVVDKPNFVPGSAIVAGTSGQGMIVNAIATTTGSFVQQATAVLQNSDVTSCMIAVDNGQNLANQIAQLEQKYNQVHFTVLSNESMGSASPANAASMSQDPAVQAFAIGWLAGLWAVYQAHSVQSGLQPAFGYDATGITNNVGKAFFTGLYTSDPNAVVRLLSTGKGSGKGNTTGSANGFGSGWTNMNPPVTSLILGAKPTSALTQSILAQSPTVFALHSFGGIQAAVKPGQLNSVHFEQELSQITRGQWQSGDESVMDPSSISINRQLVPSQTVDAWNALQPKLTGNLWKTDYQNLPQSTKNLLQAQFGIS